MIFKRVLLVSIVVIAITITGCAETERVIPGVSPDTLDGKITPELMRVLEGASIDDLITVFVYWEPDDNYADISTIAYERAIEQGEDGYGDFRQAEIKKIYDENTVDFIAEYINPSREVIRTSSSIRACYVLVALSPAEIKELSETEKVIRLYAAEENVKGDLWIAQERGDGYLAFFSTLFENGFDVQELSPTIGADVSGFDPWLTVEPYRITIDGFREDRHDYFPKNGIEIYEYDSAETARTYSTFIDARTGMSISNPIEGFSVNFSPGGVPHWFIKDNIIVYYTLTFHHEDGDTEILDFLKEHFGGYFAGGGSSW